MINIILVFLQKIKSEMTISEKINIYEETINFPGLKCGCGCTDFNVHGYYYRNVVMLEDAYTIRIQRVKCNRCGRTHSITPPFLFPNYQTVAEVIIEHTSKMVDEEKSTVEVEKETGISRQKLLQWKKRYYALKTTIRETFSKVLKVKEFFDEKKRLQVYHNWNVIFLIQMTT